MSSIRKPLKRAEAELNLRKQPDANPFAMEQACDPDEEMNESAAGSDQNAAAISPAQDDSPDSIPYRDNPDFGIF